MNPNKKYQVKYVFVDFEEKERQKRLDDAFDYLFDELKVFETEHKNNKDEYEQQNVIRV
jgi:uncharacterized membrane protein